MSHTYTRTYVIHCKHRVRWFAEFHAWWLNKLDQRGKRPWWSALANVPLGKKPNYEVRQNVDRQGNKVRIFSVLDWGGQ